jgi:hypothetical protein
MDLGFRMDNLGALHCGEGQEGGPHGVHQVNVTVEEQQAIERVSSLSLCSV